MCSNVSTNFTLVLVILLYVLTWNSISIFLIDEFKSIIYIEGYWYTYMSWYTCSLCSILAMARGRDIANKNVDLVIHCTFFGSNPKFVDVVYTILRVQWFSFSLDVDTSDHFPSWKICIYFKSSKNGIKKFSFWKVKKIRPIFKSNGKLGCIPKLFSFLTSLLFSIQHGANEHM